MRFTDDRERFHGLRPYHASSSYFCPYRRGRCQIQAQADRVGVDALIDFFDQLSKGLDMAKPIQATPPLDGADAAALLAALESTQLSPEEMARRAEHSRAREFMAPKPAAQNRKLR